MSNILSAHGPAGAQNETNYSFSYKHKPELPYMITEGRVEHLEAIADQIEKYEKWEPEMGCS